MSNGTTELLPVVRGTLSLSSDTFASTVLRDTLTRLTGGTPIVVTGAVRSEQNGVVTVSGTTALLNVPQLPVTAVASEQPGGAVLTVRFTLIDGQPGPNTWHFSKSFPALSNVAAGTANLLDRLVLSDAAFLLSTAPATDPVTGAALVPGLNFAARLQPTGLLGLLGTLIAGGERLVLAGPVLLPLPEEVTRPLPTTPVVAMPWQVNWPVPGINLSAGLGIDTNLAGKLRFHDVALRLYCPTSQDWASANPSYWPTVAASASLDIPSAGLSLELTALGVQSPRNMTLIGLFQGLALRRLEDLLDVAGGSDLASLLPQDVQAGLASTAGRLAVRAFNLSIGQGFQILDAGIAVGIPDLTTHVLPGFTLGGLVANFSIAKPFGTGRAVSATIEAGVTFLGAPFEVTLELPDVEATARLSAPTKLALATVVSEIALPMPAGLPDLAIDDLQFYADKAGTLNFAAVMAQSPSWTIALGPVPLTIADISATLARAAGQPASSQFNGTLSLGEFDLYLAYATPGAFVLRSQVDEIRLQALVGALADEPVTLPHGFDFDFTNTEVMIQTAGADLTFLLAASMPELGTVAFQARRNAALWGYTLGIQVAHLRASQLPGLAALSVFEAMFRLDELVLVAASFDDTAFQFPSVAAFNAPSLGSGKVTLPGGGGVMKGLNIYAQWSIDTSAKDQKLLQRILGLQAAIGITLQVGANPRQDSRLYVSLATRLCGMPLQAEFGAQITGGQVALFLAGTLSTHIGGHDQSFATTMLLVPNGVLFSGSMAGTIQFGTVQLSDLALVIGCDWEGIPSIGVACAMTVRNFQSALAFFFDSTDPSRSLLAGSVSGLTLNDVLTTMVGHVAPSGVDEVLKQIALVGTSDFMLPASAADALDNLDMPAISAAFATAHVSLPTSTQNVLVNVAERGQRWFITNMADSMMQYQAVKQPNGVRVTVEPQFYLAPQTTLLGELTYPQGFFLNAGVKVLTLDGSAKVELNANQGILADGSLSRIVIGPEALFCLQSSDGKSGPRVSVATFSQPQLPQKELQAPHVLLDGELITLGLKRQLYVSVGTAGFSFEMQGTLLPGCACDLKGSFSGLSELSVGGAINIAIGEVNLGALGTANINTGADGTLDLGVKGSSAWAKYSAGFEFAGQKFNLPPIDLDVNTPSLLALPRLAEQAVAKALTDFLLKDATHWAELVAAGSIKGVQDTTKVLQSEFHQSEDEAKKTLGAVGHTADKAAHEAGDTAKKAGDDIKHAFSPPHHHHHR